MDVEKSWDELRVGVKGQSNWVIAGSPRNIFRYSLGTLCSGGRALNGLGVFTRLPNPIKLRMPLTSIPGDRLWEISSIVEREIAQTVD